MHRLLIPLSLLLVVAACRPVYSEGSRLIYVEQHGPLQEVYAVYTDGPRFEALGITERATTCPTFHAGQMGFVQRVTFSPDITDYSLHLMDLNSGTRQVIPTGRMRLVEAVWSPDGAQMVVVGSAREGSQVTGLYLADGAGGTPQPLTEAGHTYRAPTWSPDGTQIAFGSTYHAAYETARHHIYTMGLSQPGDLTRLTPSDDVSANHFLPAWSPAGEAIAYNVTRREGGEVVGEIMAYDTASGAHIRLTEADPPTVDQAPVWSPDGRHVAFLSNREATSPRRSDLYVLLHALDAPRREIIRLTHSGDVACAAWLP